jgi:hypothetical protein
LKDTYRSKIKELKEYFSNFIKFLRRKRPTVAPPALFKVVGMYCANKREDKKYIEKVWLQIR